jgi:hypothetical protein
MSDEVISNRWKEWNIQGLIPGPDENETAFIERATFCQNLEQNLVQKVGADLPFETGDHASQDLLKEALPLTKELYGISPQWTPLFFSNHQLAPWHGGCAWIFQLDEQTPTAAFLQLRARFRTRATYLGIYHRAELMAHELAHVGRMLYQEPKFEEIFAYQSSSSTWRRWLGPIVQSSKESLFFILFLGVVILTDFAFLSLHSHPAFIISWWIKSIPLIFIALALGRLIYRHWLFKNCLRNLENLYQGPQTAKHLLYRLRDCEIKEFAQATPSKIRESLRKAEQMSFRWRFLKALYPFEEDEYQQKDNENK